jgi:hypothetical protein
MREGARLLIADGIRKEDFGCLVKSLERCADRHNDCRRCPDLEICVSAFDARCAGDGKRAKQSKTTTLRRQGNARSSNGNHQG